MEQVFEIAVPGRPRPKGSMRAVQNRAQTGAYLIHDNKRTKPWQRDIEKAARLFFCGDPLASGIKLEIAFWFHKPALATKKNRPYPTVKPDLDKLTRTVLDALSGIVYLDDCQVISIDVTKRYSTDNFEGVNIKIFTY